MVVLALDTSTAVASVAVVEKDDVLAELSGPEQAKHGETLLSVIETALARASVILAEIDLIAVGIGPGSFTGVRVGLATAKGLAFATSKPLVGVVSLRALARGIPDLRKGGLIAPILDAYRDEVYAALYEVNADGSLAERVAPFNQAPEKAAEMLILQAGTNPIVLCGNGARRYAGLFAESIGSAIRWAEPVLDTPRAGALAREAIAAFADKGPNDLGSLEPLYLRSSDAQLPR